MSKIPYNSNEIETTEFYASIGFGVPPKQKFATPVTPRENVISLYNRKNVLWIPSIRDFNLLTPRIIPDNVARGMVAEANPLNMADYYDGMINKDMFGIDWEWVEQAGGSMVRAGRPLLENIEEWEDIVIFPDIDQWDWEGSAKANASYLNDGRAVVFVILNGLFERLISFLDFENAAVALVFDEQKPYVHALLDKLVILYDKIIVHAKKYYNADVINFHDDWGSQKAPFFSRKTAEEMLLPYLKRVVDSTHANGMFFDMHSCGKNEMIAPVYAEAGVDSWRGQDINDKDRIYHEIGDKTILGVDQDIEFTAATSYDDMLASAKRLVEKYGLEYSVKPITYGGPIPSNDAFGKALYEESRKYFCSL